MVKAKKGKNKKVATPTTTLNSTPSTTPSTGSSSMTNSSNSTSNPLMNSSNTTTGIDANGIGIGLLSSSTTTMMPSTTATITSNSQQLPSNSTSGTGSSNSILLQSQSASSRKYGGSGNNNNNNEDLDDLCWLREIEIRSSSSNDAEPLLQLEYNDDDELMMLLYRFLEESSANTEIIDAIYQIWQQTVLSTLLQSSATWKKEIVTQRDQKNMKDTLRISRMKINFIFHHLIGHILISTMKKWIIIRERVIDMCYNTLQLIPRLVESCQHHPTDIRLAIIHYEGKEFLANVACETWDTLYDYSIIIDHNRFVPILRRCAMLDILDKDWNMLGGWDDILKGLETKCCPKNTIIPRLPSDAILHETTTILRNARNSMQCKFFSVRFMRYTDDQAPQRYKYYPKCSAPACSNIETPQQIHPFRCYKCYYFHYCSSACQEYCDNIMGLHTKFCNDTPKIKAMLCQKETEQYLGWTLGSMNHNVNNNHDDDEDDDYVTLSNLALPSKMVVQCHACGVPEDHMSTKTNNNSNNSGTAVSNNHKVANISSSSSSSSWHNLIQMKRCVQCQRVSYCSKQCQEWDWRVGGHRNICPVIAIHNTTTTKTSNNRTTTPSTAAAATSKSATNTTSTTGTTTNTAAASMVKDLN